MTREYNVIVVGSGAGGAPLAEKLSATGKKVLIIEAGVPINPDHMGSAWKTAISNRYYHHFAAFSMSGELTTIYHTQNVGGTTVFACGNMVRSLQNKFLSLGIDLEPYFQEAEQEMGVKLLPEQRIINGTRAIIQAGKNLGYNMVPMPKGLNAGGGCDLCGECVFGCPRGVKTDARIYVNKAVKNGTELMTSTKVEKVLFSGDHVRGVKIAGRGGQEIECGLVILAAGGLNTPVILQKSGIDAGNKLFVDFFNATYGITKNLSQLKEPTMGAVCTDFHEKEGFILSPFVDPWSQTVIFCPQWWWIARHPFSWKSRKIGIMTKITDERIGRVNICSISKKPTEQDRYRLNTGAKVAEEILLEAGAKGIVTTKHARGAHPGGTAALGEVIDNNLQVKGTKGLFVCDCSTFPETPGLPPILTIIAQAKWLADQLKI